MFFNKLKELCDSRGISVYKAATSIGLNRSVVAKWKSGGQPHGTTAAKLAEFFGVTTDYLLGKEKAPTVSDERIDMSDVDIAFYGDYKELDEEQKQAIREMVRLMRQRRTNKA